MIWLLSLFEPKKLFKFAWEILEIDFPSLSPTEKVMAANIAVQLNRGITISYVAGPSVRERYVKEIVVEARNPDFWLCLDMALALVKEPIPIEDRPRCLEIYQTKKTSNNLPKDVELFESIIALEELYHE